MKQVFVMWGTTSGWEYREEWIVAAYFDETKVKAHVEKATARAKELVDKHRWHSVPENANEFDPQMQVEIDGVKYGYEAVSILG